MSDRPAAARPLPHVLLGAAIVVTGGAIAVLLPPALVGVGLLLVLLRVCWLDENIKTDLIEADEVPPDYLRAASEAPRLLAPEPVPDDPALMATALRGQIQAWMAAGLGALSAFVLIHSGWATTPAVLVAMALIALGYWQADRLVTTILHLERGEPLPQRQLARAWGFAHSWRIERDE